jgi:hypothetical protein
MITGSIGDDYRMTLLGVDWNCGRWNFFIDKGRTFELIEDDNTLWQ